MLKSSKKPKCSGCGSRAARYVLEKNRNMFFCGMRCALLGGKEAPSYSVTNFEEILTLVNGYRDSTYWFFKKDDKEIYFDDIVKNCSKLEWLEELEFITEGGYGQVFNVNDNLIIKKSRFISGLNFHANRTEEQILKLLLMHVYKHAPHVPILFGGITCLKERTLLSIQRKIKYGTLEKYLIDNYTENKFRKYVFEMAWTFACIQEKFPHFTHNDIHSTNIMIDEGDSQGYSYYKLDDKNVFKIPNDGTRSVLIDFGLSCIPGVAENSSLMQLQYTKPRIDVSAIGLAGKDLKLLIKHMLLFLTQAEIEISNRLLQELEQIYGPTILELDPYPEWPIFRVQKDTEIPTPIQVLQRGRMFDKYLKKYPDIGANDKVYTFPKGVAKDIKLDKVTPPKIYIPFAFGMKNIFQDLPIRSVWMSENNIEEDIYRTWSSNEILDFSIPFYDAIINNKEIIKYLRQQFQDDYERIQKKYERKFFDYVKYLVENNAILYKENLSLLLLLAIWESDKHLFKFTINFKFLYNNLMKVPGLKDTRQKDKKAYAINIYTVEDDDEDPDIQVNLLLIQLNWIKLKLNNVYK